MIEKYHFKNQSEFIRAIEKFKNILFPGEQYIVTIHNGMYKRHTCVEMKNKDRYILLIYN